MQAICPSCKKTIEIVGEKTFEEPYFTRGVDPFFENESYYYVCPNCQEVFKFSIELAIREIRILTQEERKEFQEWNEDYAIFTRYYETQEEIDNLCRLQNKEISIETVSFKNDGNAGLPTDYDIFLNPALKLGNLEIYPEDAPKKMTWQEAVEYCKSLGNGWRLPTKDELEMMYEQVHIYDEGCFSSDGYWSGIAHEDANVGFSYYFDFPAGILLSGIRGKDRCVRPVRTIEEEV